MTTHVHAIHETLAGLTVGAPIAHGAVTVFPLHAPASKAPDWLTLAEAGDAVNVTEISDAGAVPTLRVTNAADRPVLLLDGEELIGARQNRALNTTVLIAAHSRAPIPVSCVEQGRWSYRAPRFSSSEYWLYASVRRKKAARVTESLRERRRHDSDQGEVWDDLAEKAASLRAPSPTGAMHAVYERYDRHLTEAREAFAPASDQVGALVYVGGEWAGLELLASPSLFSRAWPRISTGYVADGIGRAPAGAPSIAPSDVIARLMAASFEVAPAVGLGTEYRVTGHHAVGAALVVEDVVAHLAAFPAVVD